MRYSILLLVVASIGYSGGMAFAGNGGDGGDGGSCASGSDCDGGDGGSGGLGGTGGDGGDGGINGDAGLPGCDGGTDPSPAGKFYISGTMQECNPRDADLQKLEQ